MRVPVARARERRSARYRDIDTFRRNRLALAVTRGDVHLVRLDRTLGSKIQKTRPCVIVSPDELNAHLRTVIVAPMTTGGRPYPFRVACSFRGRPRHIVLDQIRTVDRD